MSDRPSGAASQRTYAVGMARVPIACSLVVDDFDTRIEEWRTFLNNQVVEVTRTSREARLRLTGGDDALVDAADLARREKACCPFFEFHLALLPAAVWLVIEVPGEAISILDHLIDLRRV